MEATIIGINYEGAHFRGFASATDDRTVKFTITGDEHQIVDYLLENFSYGPDPQVTTLVDMVEGVKNSYNGNTNPNEDDGDEEDDDGEELAMPHVTVFDGCGGIIKVEHEGSVLLDLSDDFNPPEGEQAEEIIDLGNIGLSNLEPEGYYDHINFLLQQKLAAGQLPKRKDDPDNTK